MLADAERIARARQPQLTVSGELTSVRTVRALAERSEKVFELVVGNRGLGGFTGLVLGSVGLGAVRHTAAAREEARLRVVHAWPFPKALDEPGAGADIRRIEERARWRVIEAHAPMRKRFPGLQVVEDIVQDNPAAALVAASRDTDLVIAGSHPREGLTVPRARAVTHALLHQAHCPVAVVPTPAAP
ncbi:universal stress protein [Actinomadura madurae]|uniref:universal stress protein n=1 Tax=Actinomadura madurae TaxID=1993 RepID=UPI0020D2615C|nr:universal stress protein [Actinomadura madurae]MCP9955454.1 universal stress protein [Actinomadura madurae]MCP9972190.1 universal stress protein [Actinomadura madurae]MCP9984692.1 universal stress protein [Actinomadura madurae]MCQ0003756.1 universal stress protein [Actinomadura madurae]MCQ0020885.1 universal stress protein [Actinomadura madurae]